LWDKLQRLDSNSKRGNRFKTCKLSSKEKSDNNNNNNNNNNNKKESKTEKGLKNNYPRIYIVLGGDFNLSNYPIIDQQILVIGNNHEYTV